MYDTTVYAFSRNIHAQFIARLENDSSLVIKWFADNFIKLSTVK